MTFKYNLSGALIGQQYPSGRVVKNAFDATGDLSRIYGNPTSTATEQTYATSFAYTADGKIQHLKLGNGLWEAAKLNSRAQVTELTVGHSVGNGNLLKLNYDYGELNGDGVTVDGTKNAGNIAKQTVSFAGVTNPFVQTYRFDSLDRITEAIEKVNGNQTWKQTFGYDQYGNRNARYQIVGSTALSINSQTLPPIDAYTNRYTDGQGYGFDKNGNVTSDQLNGNRTFTFNGDNKQTQVKDANNYVIGTYLYDGIGRRVKKVTDLETTVFVYNGMGNLVAEYSTATPPANPTINYTATDTLGSPRVITDKFGYVVARRDFMPFGEELFEDGINRTSVRKYSLTGQDAVRKRFTGYEKDIETGLDFAEARYYNNIHGRFTAVDPLLASGNSADPQTFNRYVYVMNNPVALTDPTGLQAGTTNLEPCGERPDCGGYTQTAKQRKAGMVTATGTVVVEVSGNAEPSVSQTLNLGCPEGANCGSAAPPSPRLDTANAPSTKTVEGIALLAEAGSALPGAGVPFAAIAGITRAFQGDTQAAGTNLLGVIPGFSALRKADQAVDAAKFSVYLGFDAQGVARYAGMTGRNPAIRFGEHALASGTGRDMLRFEVVEGLSGLTKTQGRIVEQGFINQFGMQKNGGQLLNQRNSIDPRKFINFGIRP